VLETGSIIELRERQAGGEQTSDPCVRIAELELQLEKARQDRDNITRMGAVLASITDLEEVLSVLMQMALRLIGAEVGLIMTVGPNGPEPKIVWGFDPAALHLLYYREDKNVVEWVLEKGECVIVDYSARETGFHFQGRRLMIGGAIAMPIQTKTEIVGCMVMLNKSGEEVFEDSDRDALQILVDFAGVAIEHARLLAESLEKQRLEQELSLAEEIQKTLVPAVDLVLPGVELKSLYSPLGKVGGDYFDVIPWGDGQFVLAIGDVSNKGVPAALLMTAVRSIVRSEAKRSDSTAKVVARINEVVSADLTGQRDMFITFFYALFNLREGVVTYTNAGHPPPLLLCSKTGQLTELSRGGVFLGQFPGATFTEARQKLFAGDRILTFTDGIIEAADAGQRLYGGDRLKEFMVEHKAISPTGFLEKLNQDLEENFNNADYKDDVTAVFVQIDAPEALNESG
jgi:serine phosphatase RsbU (regulator of sigma subunit)